MKNNVIIKEFTGKSKKTGKEFTCLELKIGNYSHLFFPTPIEKEYILKRVTEQAHNEFQEN